MENKKTQKEKIKEIEAIYCHYVRKMYNAQHEQEIAISNKHRAEERQDYHEAEYQRHQAEEAESRYHSFACASYAIGEALEVLTGCGIDAVLEDLHKRYNLTDNEE